MQECSEDHCTVDLQLGGRAEPPAFPHVLSKSSIGCTGFGDPVVNFGIYVDFSRECATNTTNS